MIKLLRRLTYTGALLAALVFVSGCNSLRQDMANQPRQNPLSPSDFFSDERSERALVENTVIRGATDDNQYLVPKDSNAFPIPITQEFLERGKERYGIFCTPCHGLQGDGNGMVAMRGMKHPPTYHQDRLRQTPNGYIYDVVTNGFGAMYGYSAQIPPRDRWAIIAYVRALQLSRNAPAGQLPAELRNRVAASPGANAADATSRNGESEK
ncbi:MAG TPA: cytochrome c [Candidatus Dormibacteraeota bacterium]|nr:cytochrome c [Candidatus Dormibacteraeota bacterium]